MSERVSQYERFAKKAPEVLQRLKDFQEILKDGYDCSRLPIPHVHTIRHRKCCEDVADYFVDQCIAAGLESDKYLFFDMDTHFRNKNGRITFADPKGLVLKNYPEINPWGLHFICESEGFAIEPLVGSPVGLDLISMELFGEQRSLHKVDYGRTYTFWDIIDTLDERGVLL